MVGQCRSAFDACDDGIFHQRQPPPTSSSSFNGVLAWPNEAVALQGWYQRFATTAPLPTGTQITIAVADSQALRGEASADRCVCGSLRENHPGLFSHPIQIARSRYIDSNIGCLPQALQPSCL
jgi:hypothetical protein